MVASQQSKRIARWALFGLGILFFGTLLFTTAGVHAQEFVEAGNLGLSEVQESSGLGQSSFVTIVGRIIRVILTLLGVIAIIFVIYAGFLWMTAGGSEEAIDKAKRTLANGAIGLVIVLSSYAITEFVIRSIGGATGTDTSAILGSGGDGGGNVSGGTGEFNSGGTTTSGGLQVKSIIPKGQQDYANLQVVVTFTGIIDETSVKDNVVVSDDKGPVAGSLTTNGDSVVFVPSSACAAPNGSKKCFVSAKVYTVTVTGGKAGIVSATSKKPLSCSASSCSATFTPGSKVDVTGPTISNIDPVDNEKIPVEQVVPIQALLKDDNAIALGRVEVNGQVIETVTPATNKGILPQEFFMLTKKFNTKGDAIKKEYTIKITAQDIAGNSVSLSYKVQVAPQICFNKIKDGDEIDIDCSAPGGQCGLCTNIACTNNLQCANGNFCDPNKKICGSAPVIKSVQPQDGAPGTFVTLGGDGFGTQVGEVVFMGNPKDDEDDVIAPLACSGSWTDSQAVVQIPEGAVDGPVSLRNAAGSREETNDQDGLLLTNFEVNEVERPGLCSISPATGQPGKTKVTITGNEFLSNSALERKLFIAGYLVEGAVWGEGGANTVTGFTPALEPGPVSVGITVKSIASNPLAYTVLEIGGQSVSAASVNSLSPAKGGVGQYVTIKGKDFGTTPNKVYFVVLDSAGKLTVDQTVADISFPAQCAKAFWGDTQIVVKVPNLAAGNYAVVVQPFGKTKQSTYKTFTITTDKPGPQVCAIEPSMGPADGKVFVSLYGDGFSALPGGVIFGNKIVVKGDASASSWTKNSISVVVPVGVTTGDVVVAQAQAGIAADTCTKNPSTCSNPMTYTVSDCRVQTNSCGAGTMCCGDGTCQKECKVTPGPQSVKGVFAWCFSTGDSCDKIEPPRVVEACSESDSKVIPSPSPSNMWSSTEKAGACSNAMITVKFSEPVDPQTVDITSGTESSVYVEECVAEDGSCSEVDDQLVPLTDLVVSAKVDEKNSGFFVVPKNLKPLTLYRVTLTNEILGADTGIALLGPASPLAGNKCKPEAGKGVYCFYFKTIEKQGACVVESVGVAPSTFTAEALGPIKDPSGKFGELQLWLPLAFPADKCQVLDPDSYDWSWAPSKKTDSSYNFTAALYADSSKTPFIAKQPTAPNAPAEIIATETKSKKSGKGTLAINLGVPQITEACEINGPRSPSPAAQWGGDICYDAPVVVEFNQEVVLKKQDGGEGTFDIKIWECTNTVEGKECDTVNSTALNSTMMHYSFGDARHVYKFETNPSFAKDTHYLIEVPTTTKGVGQFGKQMAQKQGCRPGVAYCFTFKTSVDDEACKVAKVEVMPFDWTAVDYGVQQSYNKAGDLVDQLWHAQAFGSNPCVWLKNKYSWNWGVDEKHLGYAAVDPSANQANNIAGAAAAGLVGKYWDFSDDQIVAAYKETASGDFVKIQAQTEGVIGESLLQIQFPTPTITKYEPASCGGSNVCSNSVIVLGFSTAMKTATVEKNVFVFKCPAQGDPDCVFTANNEKDLISFSAYPVDKSNKEFALYGSSRFSMNTKYRVILTDGMYSTADKKLVQVNYPSDKPQYFSWTFNVTKDLCSADSVKVSPVAPSAKAQGEKQAFIALAFTAPDTCYPNGQQINTTDIPWSWASSDVAVADQIAATTTNRQTFEMIGKGSVVDNVQSADITAALQSKPGTSTWKLECNAPPVKCPVGTWPGADKCCHKPPSVQATYPKAGSGGVCRNTLATIDVDDYLKGESVTSSSVRIGFASADSKECVGGNIEKGICFDKISYTLSVINTKEKNEKRTGRIVLNLGELLPANRTITLQIRPVGSDDPAGVGLKSALNVPVVGQEITFSTGDNLCELTDVAIYPKTTFFTKGSETQKFAAYGLSQQTGGLLPISSIANVYAWDWEWFSNDEKVAKFSGVTANITTPTVMPGGINGQTTVAAMAKISTDTIIKPSTLGKAVAGSASVEAMLCELPWFPEQDPKLKTILEVHNFSFWYCRSGEKMPLPKVTPVEDKLSDLNFTTMHSFRLMDTVSGGAIGFRVEKNLKQYSPLEWYLQKEFKGNPEKIITDGFNSVRVGNTVYVGFGNKSKGGAQFTNILIVSLSEPASENMKAIFSQVVKNLQFVTNVNDVGLCYNKNKSAVNKLCNADLQCATIESGATCEAAQSKFRRDMIRVVDASTMVRSIENAKALAQKYPIIATNSFIPGLASSKWPAWNSFMQQLGIDALSDPMNVYTGCGADSDSETCWSVKNKKYQCAASSLVYHYRTIKSGENFALGIPLEQEVSLQNLWQGDGWAAAKPKIENTFCIGAPLSAQSVCGDGAVGAGEQCDPAGANVGGVSVDQCPKYGDFVAKCSASCQFEQVSCVNKCGDGIVQPGAEECDEGSKYNGQYNHCGLDCKKANPLGYCGNATVEKNEVCDIGTPTGRVFANKYYSHAEDQSHFAVRCVTYKDGYEAVTFNPSTKIIENDKWLELYAKDKVYYVGSVATLGGICKTTQTIGQCDLYPMLSCVDNENCPGNSMCVKPVVGTKYAKNQIDSCNWNCKGSGSFCGDKIVDLQGGEECDGNQQGDQCTKFCTPDCKWQAQALNQTTNKVEPVCVSNDASAGPAAFVGCGDGVVAPGSGEECDSGKQNGVQCVANYGSNNSCQYCTTTCKKGFVTGGFCGDGKLGGPEMCDGPALPKLCNAEAFDYHNYACTSSCTLSGGGSCMSCAIQTTKLTKDNAQAPLAVRSPALIVDPTLGWLPGVTGINISAYRSSSVTGKDEKYEYAKNPANGDAHYFAYLKPTVQAGQVVKKIDGVAFDANPACFASGHRYVVGFENNPQLSNLSSSEQDLFPQIAGAFEYETVAKNYLTLDALKTGSTVVMKPKGQEGDLRIVFAGGQEVELWLKMSNKDGAKTSAFGQNAAGYEVRLLPAKMLGSCAESDIETFATSGNDERRRTSGCVSDAPYAEYDRAFAYTTPNSGIISEPSGRHITTIRKHNGAFYNAVYEIKVINYSKTIKFGSTNLLTVWRYTNGVWENVYQAAPPAPPANGVQVWNAFTFMGDMPAFFVAGDYTAYKNNSQFLKINEKDVQDSQKKQQDIQDANNIPPLGF